MFKFKAGNVFQKLNKMDRKKAYTLGALIVVCFIALLTLASFMGKADDASFDDFSTRGYDLAQMPFVNDEAEQYLLAAKYPDMQNNGSTLLYSAEEKEARQEEDAQHAEEYTEDSSSASSAYEAPTSRGYAGYGRGGGGTSSPTQVGQLGSASIGHASGSGINSSYGAPRGDFSPYKSQEKGSELPAGLQNKNARKALWQTARGSRAAAGLLDGKSGNAKRAMMGGNIQGAEAFTDKGVDLSKAAGLALDTNAPVTSSDLSNLDDAVSDTADKAKENDDNEKQTLGEKLLEQFLSGMVDIGLQGVGKLANWGVDALISNGQANGDTRAAMNASIDSLLSANPPYSESQISQMKQLGMTDEQIKSGLTFQDYAANKYLGKDLPATSTSFAQRQDELTRNVQNIGATADPMKAQTQRALTLKVDQPTSSLSLTQGQGGFGQTQSGFDTPLLEGGLDDALARETPIAAEDIDHTSLTDKEREKLIKKVRKGAPDTYIVSYDDNGNGITQQQYKRTSFSSHMSNSSGTAIAYNPNRTNNNNSEGLNVYLSEHCSNCTVGSTAYNNAVAEYNKKYGKK